MRRSALSVVCLAALLACGRSNKSGADAAAGAAAGSSGNGGAGAGGGAGVGGSAGAGHAGVSGAGTSGSAGSGGSIGSSGSTGAGGAGGSTANAGASGADGGGSGGNTGAGASAGAGGTSVVACPFTGKWVLRSAHCGGDNSSDTTGSLPGDVGIDRDGVTLNVTDAGGGNCKVAQVRSGPNCKEMTERNTVQLNGRIASTAAYQTTACEPSACAFVAGKHTCAVGTHTDPSFEFTLYPAIPRLAMSADGNEWICASIGLDAPLTMVFDRPSP